MLNNQDLTPLAPCSLEPGHQKAVFPPDNQSVDSASNDQSRWFQFSYKKPTDGFSRRLVKK